jgi:upstream activation factor subunit UAF30
MPKTSNKTAAAKTATPAKASKAKKTTTTKRAKTAPAAVETTPTPAVNEVTTAPVETETAAPSVLTELAESSTEFLSRLNAVASQLSALRTEFRTLEKRWTRELKAAERAQAKRKKRTGSRAPSGFVKPTLISNELASFLGKPSGTEMARTEVTKEINKYIVAHSLKDASNGRKINPNSALRSLLNIEANQELTYFNLQRYMSPHFAKSGQTEPFSTSA